MLALPPLGALHSAWIIVYLRSGHVGVVRGEDTLHHSLASDRPNELWNSVLWYGPGLAQFSHLADCKSFHIRPGGH